MELAQNCVGYGTIVSLQRRLILSSYCLFTPDETRILEALWLTHSDRTKNDYKPQLRPRGVETNFSCDAIVCTDLLQPDVVICITYN